MKNVNVVIDTEGTSFSPEGREIIDEILQIHMKMQIMCHELSRHDPQRAEISLGLFCYNMFGTSRGVIMPNVGYC